MDYAILKPAVAALLAANPAWTDQQVADSLNAPVPTLCLGQLVNFRGLMDALSVADYNTARAVLNGAAGQNQIVADAVTLMLGEKGIDFGSPKTQGMIDVLFSTAQFATLNPALKALGLALRSPAALAGLPFIYPGYIANVRATQ